MKRQIAISDLEKAVYEAYEQFKSIKGQGAVDPNITADPKTFGISVVLTDGTVINKGDATVAAVLGEVARMPVELTWLTQATPAEVSKKLYAAKKGEPKAKCCCSCSCGLSRKGVREVSAVIPQNDPDGKYDIISNTFINAMGSAPEFDDKLYEALSAKIAEMNVPEKLQEAGFDLYDDANSSIRIYTKLMSLKATAQQLATFGATIAADGRSAATGQVVFDGTISAPMLALQLKGVHKESKQWNLTVGLPARSGRGGFIVAIVPGMGAIAALSPEVDENGVSVKAREAITYIANKLQLNALASARVEIVK